MMIQIKIMTLTTTITVLHKVVVAQAVVVFEESKLSLTPKKVHQELAIRVAILC